MASIRIDIARNTRLSNTVTTTKQMRATGATSENSHPGTIRISETLGGVTSAMKLNIQRKLKIAFIFHEWLKTASTRRRNKEELDINANASNHPAARRI